MEEEGKEEGKKGKEEKMMKRKRIAGMRRGDYLVPSDWASHKSPELCRIRVLDSPDP